MTLITNAVWLRRGMRNARARDHLWAAAAMAVAPSALAVGVITGGGGCHYKRAANVYEWWCLLPVTVIMTSLGFLLLVPAAILVGHIVKRRLRIGWLTATLAGGILAQVVLVVSFRFAIVGDGVNPLTTTETLFMPWPFLAGAVSASVYWAVLVWRLDCATR